MAIQLRRTWVVLALALLATLPVAVIVLRGYSADVFPQCRGTLERVGAVARRGGSPSDYVPLDADRGGFSLHLDTIESEGGQVTWAKVVRVEADDRGAARECGGVLLRDAGVSTAGGVLWPQPDGAYVYVDNRWHVEGTAFRPVEHPSRHLQRSRLVARRHLPTMVAVFALLALCGAVLRARRGMLYALKLHAWLEGRVEPGGRIESDSGETVGVLADGAARIAGPVLVSPTARKQRGVYRELPLVARHHIALGTHARWRDATMRGLRDAQVLAIVGAVCSVAALAASVLGG